jgi:hypothetical protein
MIKLLGYGIATSFNKLMNFRTLLMIHACVCQETPMETVLPEDLSRVL